MSVFVYVAELDAVMPEIEAQTWKMEQLRKLTDWTKTVLKLRYLVAYEQVDWTSDLNDLQLSSEAELARHFINEVTFYTDEGCRNAKFLQINFILGGASFLRVLYQRPGSLRVLCRIFAVPRTARP